MEVRRTFFRPRLRQVRDEWWALTNHGWYCMVGLVGQEDADMLRRAEAVTRLSDREAKQEFRRHEQESVQFERIRREWRESARPLRTGAARGQH